MGRHKERILSFQRYCPFEVIQVNPARITPDECKAILKEHVGRNTTIYIERGATTTDIINPKTLFNAKRLDPKTQQNFLEAKASSIQNARRVFIKTSTLPLCRN